MHEILSTKSNRSCEVSLTLKKVYKYFGKKCVLNDISLTITNKTFTAIIGNNGAGKTTLANILSGYWSISKGEKSSSNLRPERVSYLFQTSFIDRHLSIKSNLSIIALMKNMDSKLFISNVMHKLNKIFSVRLDQNLLVKELSGGQKRMLEFCIIVDAKSDLLILDEPTVGLDFFAKEKAINYIREIITNFKGLFVICTHDEEEFRLANHFLLLANNTIRVNQKIENDFKSIYKKYQR